jgi:hypothetical protein
LQARHLPCSGKHFGARSLDGPQRLAAEGPRAPFHNNTQQKKEENE